MKKTFRFIFIAVVIIIITLIIVSNVSKHRTVRTVLTSNKEIETTVITAILDHKRVLKFESTVAPDEAITDKIFQKAMNSDPYAASEFYSYWYSYSESGGHYYVTVKFEKPSAYASAMTKIRARQIAKCFNRRLNNDYEKVKAVHDYLIKLNKYSVVKGGAYSCLYLRRSACNGYAYSFYLIMQEMGIPVTCEIGGSHAWNKVMLDGEWYNIDVTWDDQSKGVVGYDYFLKCDADWRDHEHAGATAQTSLGVEGREPYSYYMMVPNYNLFGKFGFILAAAAFIFFCRLALKASNKRELKKIEEQLEAEQKAREIFEEELKKKREAFAQENHDIW
ncbi:MAG: hypothetical protein IKI20_03205 [Lachnospiraceae bacterium]|nr:hypothetical protein [Lachnospiraceae bacterium]